MLFNFRVPAWGNEGADGHALFRGGESLKDLAFILSTIGTDGLHRRLDLIEQGADLRGIIHAGRGQGLRDDLAGGFLDAEVQLAPRTPLAPPC